MHLRDPETVIGLLYVPAQPLPEVELPPDAITGIPVSHADLATARHVGTYRVLVRLGRRERFFPFPPWGARDGRPGAPPGADAGSMLERMPQIRLSSVTLLVRDHIVEMAVPRADAELLLSLLAKVRPETAVAILGSPAPEANAFLVWSPGQVEREASQRLVRTGLAWAVSISSSRSSPARAASRSSRMGSPASSRPGRGKTSPPRSRAAVPSSSRGASKALGSNSSGCPANSRAGSQAIGPARIGAHRRRSARGAGDRASSSG